MLEVGEISKITLGLKCRDQGHGSVRQREEHVGRAEEHFFKKIGIILILQKSYKNSTKNSHIPSSMSPD